MLSSTPGLFVMAVIRASPSTSLTEQLTCAPDPVKPVVGLDWTMIVAISPAATQRPTRVAEPSHEGHDHFITPIVPVRLLVRAVQALSGSVSAPSAVIVLVTGNDAAVKVAGISGKRGGSNAT